MSENKLTIEELEKQRDEAKKSFELLDNKIKAVKKEEEDRQKAEFEFQRASRENEVKDAYDKYNKLLKDFINDYGYFAVATNADDYFNSPFYGWLWRF